MTGPAHKLGFQERKKKNGELTGKLLQARRTSQELESISEGATAACEKEDDFDNKHNLNVLMLVKESMWIQSQ